MFGASIYKDGIPAKEKIVPMLKVAFILAPILSLFSSHSHIHYLTNLMGK
jgi:hypothetical protein